MSWFIAFIVAVVLIAVVLITLGIVEWMLAREVEHDREEYEEALRNRAGYQPYRNL